MEIITGVERRRRWRAEGSCGSSLNASGLVPASRRSLGEHDVSSGLLWNWRRQARRGLLRADLAPSFFPVQVTDEPISRDPGQRATSMAVPPRMPTSADAQIEIMLRGWHHGSRRTTCQSGDFAPGDGGAAWMIPAPSGVRVWLAAGATDMRRGMNGLALQVQQALRRDPHAGDLYVFRGKRGDLMKILWHDGLGMSLYAKRLERGRFIWPTPTDGVVAITAAQLGYMLEGIDWRNPLAHGGRRRRAESS